jgi:hypothetical protein
MIFLWLSFFIAPAADAAPCCAGSSALPSLITGDEARLIGMSVSYSDVIGDAPGAGKGIPVFRDAYSIREIRKNMNLSFATLISDRWQVGVSLPIVQNELASNTTQEINTQLGDVSATIGFEALPEWEYSLWTPRIYTFVQWVAPTGGSIWDSQTRLASDVSGVGFHQLNLGAVVIKRWSDWDANVVLKAGRDLNFNGTLLNSSFGTGYSFADVWRIGGSLETQYVSSQDIGGAATLAKLVWNTGATVTCLVGSSSSLVLGYVDQTLFGPAYNTTLARTGSFSFQHRFER